MKYEPLRQRDRETSDGVSPSLIQPEKFFPPWPHPKFFGGADAESNARPPECYLNSSDGEDFSPSKASTFQIFSELRTSE